MVNKRGKTSRKIKNKNIKIISIVILTGVILIGFGIGWLVKPNKTVETIRTVEVPVKNDSLPVVSEVDYFDVPLSHNLQKFIYEVSADEGVPVTLVLAIIDVESSFNPELVSETDDTGLMQINRINFAKVEEKYHTADMTDPYQNVYVGIKIISQYLKTYDGDVTKALMCYNLGEYGANKAWNNEIYSTEYSNKVEAKWEEYQNAKNN